jgi:hypothetical protein
MKRSTFALLALTLVCAAADAAAVDDAALTFECAHVRAPRMSAVSAVTGIDNFSHAYAAREMYLHQALRLCRNPAVAVVHFVPDSTVTVSPLDSIAAR